MNKLFVTLLIALTLSACSGDDDGGNGRVTFSVPAEYTIAINEPVLIKITAGANTNWGGSFCYSHTGSGTYATVQYTGEEFVDNTIGLKYVGKSAGVEPLEISCQGPDLTAETYQMTTTITVTDTVMTSVAVSDPLVEFDLTTIDFGAGSASIPLEVTGSFSDGSTKNMIEHITAEEGWGPDNIGNLAVWDGAVNLYDTLEPARRTFRITNGLYEGDANYLSTTIQVVAGYPVASHLAGRWQFVHDGSTKLIGSVSELDNLVEIDVNHLKSTKTDGSVHHLLRAGIPNVQLKGELKSFADVAASKSLSTKTGQQKGFGVIGGIGVIIGGVGCYNVQPATITNPAGELVPATTIGGCDDAYVDQTTGGGLDMGSNPGIVAPTGSTDIIISDEDGNTSTFSVDVIGEETDVGVLNIPDGSIQYNFKSTVQHLNDYIYFSALPYVKNVKVCNVGAANIDGMTMAFNVDAADTALVGSFSHNDTGTATNFASGECKTIQFSLTFTKPVVDDDVKINIDITNNFTSVTWNDYVSFKLSSFDSVPLYFASNVENLNGYLVAPGRQLVKVGFSGFNANTNFVRVPLDTNSEYELALAAANITNADSYMISTLNAPDTSLFTGFSDVGIYEPDDDSANATPLSYSGTERISYLGAGDIDIYKIFNY